MDRPILAASHRILQTSSAVLPQRFSSSAAKLQGRVPFASRRSLSSRALLSTPTSKPFIRQRCNAAHRAASRRQFSASATHREVASLNPRYKEDGEEMTIEITPRAANRLMAIREKDKNPNLALRVTVESGGCHGFQYLMSLTDISSGTEHPKPEDSGDTVFEGRDGAKVVMDEPSLELLHGSKVDYTMELIGSQFKITGNPRASSSCGCGTSFDVKMD